MPCFRLLKGPLPVGLISSCCPFWPRSTVRGYGTAASVLCWCLCSSPPVGTSCPSRGPGMLTRAPWCGVPHLAYCLRSCVGSSPCSCAVRSAPPQEWLGRPLPSAVGTGCLLYTARERARLSSVRSVYMFFIVVVVCSPLCRLSCLLDRCGVARGVEV